jgi:hypothetical protein
MNITTKNNNEAELITKETLERILKTYDLIKYIRCNEVIIEQGATGKAYPIIRLSAWRADSEEGLLAQFLHEQFHWIAEGKVEEMRNAMSEVKDIFPNAPIDKPEGGGSEKSTYTHLIVCRLELLALGKILGEEKALKIVSGNRNYTWIRKMVIERGSEIDPIIEKFFPEVINTF